MSGGQKETDAFEQETLKRRDVEQRIEVSSKEKINDSGVMKVDLQGQTGNPGGKPEPRLQAPQSGNVELMQEPPAGGVEDLADYIQEELAQTQIIQSNPMI